MPRKTGAGARGGHYRRDFITERSDGFAYRRAVPKRLQGVVGKTSWSAWLGNVGRREAERRARLIAAEHDQLVARLDGLTEAEQGQLEDATGLEPWVSQKAMETHVSLPLMEGLMPYIGSDDASPDSQQLADLRLKADVEKRLSALRASVASARGIARKLTGEPSGLGGLIDLHLKVKAPRNPETENVARRTVKWFIEHVGDKDPDAITRDDVIAFRDHLEGSGKTATSVTKALNALHALFNTALSEGLIQFNPAAKVKARPDPKRKYSDGRKPFSPEQLRLILDRCGELSPDDRTVIRMMIYSGARSGELCALRACDIVNIGGIDAISINDEGENRSVKNRGSLRTVPLHPVIREEIVALAERVRSSKGADARLFAYSYVPSKGSFAHRFQEHFSRWLRGKLKITDKRFTAHSIRHAFIDACRNAGVPENVAMSITGHVGKTEHAAYGEGPSLTVKAKWIARVDPTHG